MADLALPLPAIDPALRRGAQAPDASKVQTMEQAKHVAREFERMFLAEMLQPMFAGIETDGPFGGGQAEEMFRPMLIDQYADALSASGGVGIADAVLSELIRMQGLK